MQCLSIGSEASFSASTYTCVLYDVSFSVLTDGVFVYGSKDRYNLNHLGCKYIIFICAWFMKIF